jgi:hypothetical protein
MNPREIIASVSVALYLCVSLVSFQLLLFMQRRLGQSSSSSSSSRSSRYALGNHHGYERVNPKPQPALDVHHIRTASTNSSNYAINSPLNSAASGAGESMMTAKFHVHSRIFFFVLGVSALLDLPMYVGCIEQQGPTDCEWDNYQYSLFLGLHFVALCGYFYCLGVPLFLWAEVISNKEGGVETVLSSFDTKKFLYLSITCYTILQFIRIIGLFSAPVSNHHSFQHTQVYPCSLICGLRC